MKRRSLSVLITAVMLVTTASAVFGQTPEAPADQPVVRLVEPGAEPRQELRYQFQVGHTETLTMDMGMRMSMSMAGQVMPEVALPTMRMAMTITTTEVTPDGLARFDFAMTSADVLDTPDADPMVVAQLNASMAQIVGLSGWAQVDSRGYTLDGAINLPPDADPSLAQLMDSLEQSIHQMSAPLPAEPVGVGGSWEVTTSLDTGGFAVDQTAGYVMTALEGTTAAFNVTMNQVAGSQPMEMPGLPPGAVVNLDSLSSTGTGTMSVDFTSLVPTSTLVMSTEMVATISAQGETHTMNMTMGIDVAIQPTAAE